MNIKNIPQYYAGCFGKSTIPADHPDYLLIRDTIASILVAEEVGVVQGGYGGGAMGAVDEGAVTQATRLKKDNPEKWSIGVPVEHFEEGWGKTTKGVRVMPVETLEERLEVFDSLSDFFVVLPRGGTGTAHELIHFLTKSAYFNTNPKPMILYGNQWKLLLETLFMLSDTSDTIASFPWIHVVTSPDEFGSAVRAVVKDLMENK